jgi:predicted ABC-type ATPase
MKQAGLEYHPPEDYAKLNKDRAQAIAKAFDQEVHNPNDPKVKASYEALAKETIAQWNALKGAGIKVEWVKPGMKDPYAASPRLAAMDVAENKHWWGFPTDQGFGSDEESKSYEKDNPMLAPVKGEIIDGRPVVVNDVFRIVHDMFGHLKEGNGFRAEGEENAWRSHAAMFSPLARAAMTNETRGQNSWVNYGPYGEKNRTASAADTHFAPQKIGLLPDWATQDGEWKGVPSEPEPENTSKTPAGDLLAAHSAGNETMADVEKQLTPKQLSMVAEATKGLEGQQTTQQKFMKNGVYTPERAKVHADILNKMFSGDVLKRAVAPEGTKPTLTLTGGRAAAGKTSTLDSELKDVKNSAVYINPDDIQEQLPGYNGAKAGLFHDEASDIATQVENVARQHGLNVVYDATLRNRSTAAQRVKAYKDAGYDVNGYFVHTTPLTSAVRSVQRFEQAGRFVPPAYALSSRSNEATFDSLIPEFKKWAVYDNNGDKPKKVASHG